MLDVDLMINIFSACINIAAAIGRTPFSACATAAALAAAGCAIFSKIMYD